jgi:enolase-phosphatase E1
MSLGRGIAGARDILLDIEGTITPISFVHDVLFPYSRSQLRSFLAKEFRSNDVIDDLARLREEHEVDRSQNMEPPPLVDGAGDDEMESIVAYVNWLIDRDRKSIGLKSLQGKIWKRGYFDGTLKAPLFADVAPALEHWHKAGLRVSIFSSGSLLAQKLLFAHTQAGDLTPLIDDYFDTGVGSKTNVESYRRIAAALRLPTREIVFISDVVAELDAAQAAGIVTRLCVRPGNQILSFPGSHQIIQGFDEIWTE